jgi:hypothetical protein
VVASLLWAAAVFVGSGLLFVIQPMIAKMLLPRVGGAPSTWTTCVLFFQAVLLAGYVYAHWIGRRPPRTQVAIHGALLLLPLAVLPFSIGPGVAGTDVLGPTLWLLRAPGTTSASHRRWTETRRPPGRRRSSCRPGGRSWRAPPTRCARVTFRRW